jgi:hypothetical protein
MSFRERFNNFIKIATGNKKLSEIYSERRAGGTLETDETPDITEETSPDKIQRAKEKLKKIRKPGNRDIPEEKNDKENEPSQLGEKIEDIREMFDHVIRPEERNWKN